MLGINFSQPRARLLCIFLATLSETTTECATRGQWPYRPAATRAMRNRHVVLYDLNYPTLGLPWRPFDFIYER